MSIYTTDLNVLKKKMGEMLWKFVIKQNILGEMKLL